MQYSNCSKTVLWVSRQKPGALSTEKEAAVRCPGFGPFWLAPSRSYLRPSFLDHCPLPHSQTRRSPAQTQGSLAGSAECERRRCPHAWEPGLPHPRRPLRGARSRGTRALGPSASLPAPRPQGERLAMARRRCSCNGKPKAGGGQVPLSLSVPVARETERGRAGSCARRPAR